MDDDYEFILLRKFNVNLFKLPAKNIMGAKGHLLNSWKDNFWAGKINISVIARESAS